MVHLKDSKLFSANGIERRNNNMLPLMGINQMMKGYVYYIMNLELQKNYRL